MRMFIAIELADEVRQHLVRAQDLIAPVLDDVRMTRPQSLHVTVKFLGEVQEKQVMELCDSLGRVTSGAIELIPAGLQCFPPHGPFRIVAAEMAGSESAIKGLHQAIEQRCSYLGFEREARRYRPHVTLGRAKRPVPRSREEHAKNATEKLWPGPPVVVNEFVLMQSHLKPGGSEYLVAARFPI